MANLQSTRVYQKIQIGARFGRWTVIGAPVRDGKCWRALCRCACGTERYVLVYHLANGETHT